ncbi:hypothetical protein UPYG_G00279980 [Umbra pygmaea]|uniref:Uncharacterized protein n=1 Tax=Umbra pygmaea TaxID=75934 RepID=A0ABD0WRT0_UMBPY
MKYTKGNKNSSCSFIFLPFQTLRNICVLCADGGYHVSPRKPVPVGEERSKVCPGHPVVSIVFGRPAPQAKGHQAVQRPGEVVAAVVLCGDDDGEHHEAPGGQTVALQQQGVHRSPEAHADQLPGGEVLSHQAEGLEVLVMHDMERPVQPGDPVVDEVPEVVLEVEQKGAAQDAEEEAG